MKRGFFGFIVVFLFLALQTPLQAATWNKITPGGGAVCARGGTYSFWYHQGTSNNLMVYFQGGGSCADGVSCATATAKFKDSVNNNDSPSVSPYGFFDLNNSSNPFSTYSIVFAPYCTGDMHMGNNVQQYTDRKGVNFTINHYGFVNASSVLNWTYNQYPTPDKVVVAGCSAGGVGSSLLSPYVLQHYASIPSITLDDSGSMATSSADPIPTQWGAAQNFPTFVPGVSDFTSSFQPVGYESDVTSYFPQTFFSQVNHAYDHTQATASFATPTVFNQSLLSNLNAIEATSSNFIDYEIAGNKHCSTNTSEFYTASVSGTYLSDWVNGLVNGSGSQTVRCNGTDCLPN